MGDEQPMKGGRLARQAAMLCQNRQFREWLDIKRGTAVGCHDEERTRNWLVSACKIKSRAEIDHNEYAAKMFRKIVRSYMAATGATP